MEVDQSYFERLVGKAILFRRTEKIVQTQGIPGYRANIVTYTLAYIFHATAQRIDLQRVWRDQEMSDELEDLIDEISSQVRDILLDAPGRGNVTEWAKSKRCWDRVLKEVHSDPLNILAESLLQFGRTGDSTIDQGVESVDRADHDKIEAVKAVTADTWFSLSS